MPELRLVVLALQDKLAYGTTFQAALSSLFGGGSSSLSAAEPAQPGPASTKAETSPAEAKEGVDGLIAEAARDFDDYQKLTAAGRLSEAGQKLEALKKALDRLQARSK